MPLSLAQITSEATAATVITKPAAVANGAKLSSLLVGVGLGFSVGVCIGETEGDRLGEGLDEIIEVGVGENAGGVWFRTGEGECDGVGLVPTKKDTVDEPSKK